MTLNFLRGPTSGHLDASRILWVLGGLGALGFTGAHLYLNHAFDIMQFGTGYGLLLAGGGAATAAKDTAVAKAVATGNDSGGTQ